MAIGASLIITWLIVAVSLIIISRLNVGIGIADFGKALVAAIVIGLINALLGPLFGTAGMAPDISTIGVVALIVNALALWLAAQIVPGFTLQRGFWSALLGAVLLAIVYTLLAWLLAQLGIG